MGDAIRFVPRVLVLITIVVSLLGGLGSGLARLGWDVNAVSRDWIMTHGPLMISGFLGTLICLERAVALANRYRWSFIVPAINALGAVALLTMHDSGIARLILTVGSLGLVLLFRVMLRLHPSRDVVIMAVGVVCWLIGNVLWLSGQPVYQVVHLWTAFLILTIVGERLELSRIRRLPRIGEQLLILAVGVYLTGVALTIFNLDAGLRLLGFGALLLMGWLLRYDVAGRTIRQNGLPRYIAACLIPGYLWLGVGGIFAMWKGAVFAGPDYSVILHAFLLGFVFSMIFGHAPIILPALTSLKVNYTPVLYGHLVLLHLTLIYRTFGNLTNDFAIRQQGGLLNVLSILLFMGVMVIIVVRSNLLPQRS